MQTSYITIDLDIESSRDLTPLARSSDSEDVLVHFCGPDGSGFRTTLGIAGLDVDENQAIKTYSQFLDLHEPLLSELEPRIVFNFGYEALEDEAVYRSTISPDSIEEIARWGGEIMVTLYRRSPE